MFKSETDEEILAPNPQSEANNERINELAMAVDKVCVHLENMVVAMSQGVVSGAIPQNIANAALKKWHMGFKLLWDAVDNQSRLQFVLALEELRKERGGYVEEPEIERAGVVENTDTAGDRPSPPDEAAAAGENPAPSA